ncbi:terpenoid synthase [Favolaschia claudopus]|uniref:Terpenoid synthase n=1 Tax=Favolaschia claudopus TaxID=2862362 RepID=A0AAV9Z535_9AGAR
MATQEYTQCYRHFLKEIGFRYEPLASHNAQYWGAFHHWMLEILGPTFSWTNQQLAELEHIAGTIPERAFPYASMAIKLLYARLTAIAFIIDDSITDEVFNTHLVQFSDRLYRGEDQQHPLLALYHDTLKELSQIHGQDAVVRGLALVPWLNHADACLMEKQLFIMESKRSEADGAELARLSKEDKLASKFPHYLRYKSGISEAYVAGIFKADKDQCLPWTKYIKAVPDIVFFIEITNDVLSFHKEEMESETYNLIHFRTRSTAASGNMLGTGPDGIWTCYDTLRVLCDEIRDATHRIDGLLRLEECERKLRGDDSVSEIDDIDIAVAMQWRGWRHGFISYHLECRRYKLDFLREMVEAEQNGENS